MKKILINIIILIFAGITSISCGSDKARDEAADSAEIEGALYKEVMEVHDEVMPKMDDIMRLKDSLRKKMDSIPKNDINIEERRRLQQAIKELERADEVMMQWMRNFQPQDDIADKEKVINYYKQQKTEIKEVKAKMLKAIDDGRGILRDAG